MASRSKLEMVAVSAKLPRGQDGMWKLIRELDETGKPWTVKDVAAHTNLRDVYISRFVTKLQSNGLAEVVAARPIRPNIRAEQSYRLLQRPVTTPRFSAQGKLLPETRIERLWRTMKMLKTFTVSELVDAASSDMEIKWQHANHYVRELRKAGVVATIVAHGSHREGRYQLVRNLGLKAPQILQLNVVFDPNANAVIGEAIAREVQA